MKDDLKDKLLEKNLDNEKKDDENIAKFFFKTTESQEKEKLIGNMKNNIQEKNEQLFKREKSQLMLMLGDTCLQIINRTERKIIMLRNKIMKILSMSVWSYEI